MALIAGPTASGKSALALALAEAEDGIVINGDSAQIYRDLPILSAAPSAADEARAEVDEQWGRADGIDPDLRTGDESGETASPDHPESAEHGAADTGAKHRDT